MMSQVKIEAELVRLAQARVRTTGAPLANELSRMVVEETVTRLNPELGWMVDSDRSWNQNDWLAAQLGVNDLVVNGIHIDVRAVDANGEITVNRALVGTSYLTHGTLVVEMTGPHSGRFAGHIPASDWMAADRQCRDSSLVAVQFSSAGPVNLAQVLAAIACEPANGKARSGAAPELTELTKFVANRTQIGLPRQRQIIESALVDGKVLRSLEQVASLWSDGTLARLLTAGSVWNSRVERLTDRIAPKFKKLNRERIKQQILRTGEKFGGQPESPQFRKALLATLAKEEVLSRFQGVDLARLGQAVDRVLSGRTAVDAVKDLVKSRYAVELAMVIKSDRRKFRDFVSATAEEIGLAFNQLALKPAYATHSAEQEAGVETVNEALAMLQAGELVEELRKIEADIS